MKTQPNETIRLSYQLPAGMHSPTGAWLPSDTTSFPDDRAHMMRRNADEMREKAAAGLITRRAH